MFSTISSKQYQIQQSEIKENGKIPVVSQSQRLVEGYSDNVEKMLHVKTPLIIFGDHTRIAKFIDFSFIVGADGVKIIKPLIDDLYAFYLIQHAVKQIENKGYSRHFQFLAKQRFNIPPYEEQKRIVKIINNLFSKLDTITADL